MIIVGISGPSCSGKTTLATNLWHIFSSGNLIQLDNFYLPDNKIPRAPDGTENWDCPEAVDMDRLATLLKEAKKNNSVSCTESRLAAAGAAMAYDLNNMKTVSPQLAHKLRQLSEKCTEPVLFVEGILLYHEKSPVRDLIDVKILLRSDYKTLKQRRERRPGYETFEGFWRDPPGYFDKIVCPEYQKHYEYLYDADGQLTEAAKKMNIIELQSDDLDSAARKISDAILIKAPASS